MKDSSKSITIFGLTGLISLIWVVQSASDIFLYERMISTNPATLLKIDSDKVQFDNSFIAYRNSISELVMNSSSIGVNRKITLVKRYESTGNLEYAAKLYIDILGQNPRAHEALYRLADIYSLLGDSEKADYYLLKAEEVLPRL